MAARVMVKEFVVMEQQVEAVGLGMQVAVKTVWEVRAKAGINVDMKAGYCREAGQGCRVSVEKEVYSLKRFADVV